MSISMGPNSKERLGILDNNSFMLVERDLGLRVLKEEPETETERLLSQESIWPARSVVGTLDTTCVL
jgi:hypothetical protein